MSKDIFHNLKVEGIYLENTYQKILMCKEREGNNAYLVNAIMDRQPLEGIDLQMLQEKVKLYEDVLDTEDIIYFMTQYSRTKELKDYLSEHKIKLSTQVEYITYIMDLLMHLKEMPAYIAHSLLNHHHFYIDKQNKIKHNGLLIFDEDYSDKHYTDVFIALADLIAIVFSGEEVKEGKLSHKIPPDMQKIINNCLTTKYIEIDEVVQDFKASKLYRLINPEVTESKRTHSIRRNLYWKRKRVQVKKWGIIAGLLAILLLPLFVLGGKALFKTSENPSSTSGKESVQASERDSKSTNQLPKTSDDSEEDTEKHRFITKETLQNYYNEKLLQMGEDDTIGELDTSKYYTGSASIKAINEDGETKDILVGGIDISDEEFKHIKGKKIDFSLWLHTEEEQTMMLSLRVLKEGKLLTQAGKKIYVPRGAWTLESIKDMGIGQGDYVKIYLTTYTEGEVWVDGFSVDILK